MRGPRPGFSLCHDRALPGYPRLSCVSGRKTWVAGASGIGIRASGGRRTAFSLSTSWPAVGASTVRAQMSRKGPIGSRIDGWSEADFLFPAMARRGIGWSGLLPGHHEETVGTPQAQPSFDNRALTTGSSPISGPTCGRCPTRSSWPVPNAVRYSSAQPSDSWRPGPISAGTARGSG